MPRRNLVPLNWSAVAVVAFCLAAWTFAACGSYRAVYGEGPGLRSAVQAKAVRVVHKLRRWMA